MALTDDIPAPWRITDNGSNFKIRDAQGRGLVWVHYATNDALHGKYLSREQAWEMVKAIARLSQEG